MVVFLGLRTEVRKGDVTESHASIVGFLDVWKANKK